MGKKIVLANGPNLNLLGQRETSIYGSESLLSIVDSLSKHAKQNEIELVDYQSNSEGALIDIVQDAYPSADGIIINAGAYSHTSIGLRDAIAAVDIPVVEVHLSNVFARDEFRHNSFLAPVCLGVISGFGRWSYFLALDALIHHLSRDE